MGAPVVVLAQRNIFGSWTCFITIGNYSLNGENIRKPLIKRLLRQLFGNILPEFPHIYGINLSQRIPGQLC